MWTRPLVYMTVPDLVDENLATWRRSTDASASSCVSLCLCCRAVQFSPPGYSMALNNLAVTLHAQGKRQEAIHYYTRSLEGKVSQATFVVTCSSRCLDFRPSSHIFT